jgi:predicted O-methyltransferase YrrM
VDPSEAWDRVERYLDSALIGSDDDLERAAHQSDRAGLPQIAVSPNQGKLLHLLARSIGARRILEIGTLGGYSTIWLARAVAPDGSLVSLERDPRHAEVATANLTDAGLAATAQVRVGPALDSLEALGSEGGPPFDMVFIDADKRSSPEYLDWALRLSRPGALVVLDNVVRRGQVVDAASDDPDVIGIRRAIEAMGSDPRIDATTVQTVGSKGWDGFALGLVVDPERQA